MRFKTCFRTVRCVLLGKLRTARQNDEHTITAPQHASEPSAGSPQRGVDATSADENGDSMSSSSRLLLFFALLSAVTFLAFTTLHRRLRGRSIRTLRAPFAEVAVANRGLRRCYNSPATSKRATATCHNSVLTLHLRTRRYGVGRLLEDFERLQL